MEKSRKAVLVRDIKFFSDIRALCTAALLAACGVVIAYICKSFTITPSLRVTFENLPLIMSGYIFGPFMGFMTGLVSDTVSTAATYGFSGINPILTIGAASVGLVSGCFSHFIIRKTGNLQIVFTVFASHLIGNIFIKSFGLWLYYSTPMPEIIMRTILYIAIGTAESFLLTAILKSKGIKRSLGGIL